MGNHSSSTCNKAYLFEYYIASATRPKICPESIVQLIRKYVGSQHGELILVSDRQWAFDRRVLQSNHQYEYDNILLKGKYQLSVEPWNTSKLYHYGAIKGVESVDQQKGGRLLLRSFSDIDIVIEKDAQINLTCCGYRGTNNSSKGNGKGGGQDKCGAGYGSRGNSRAGRNTGGKTYGDRLLKTLHLGSAGGGSTKWESGGGGALKIECKRLEIMGKIEVNGGNSKWNGGSSGGSILIVCNKLIMHQGALITAIGGKCETIYEVSGGDGRIRIKACNVAEIQRYVANKQIMPEPFIG